jgi:hypothetical protein
MRIVIVLCCATTWLLTAGVADSAAHGAHGHHEPGQAIIVSLAADHGPAASGWRCAVLDPDGQSWSEGRLDPRGRIAFVPDRPGTWTVRAFAADGHGAELDVEVDADLLARLRGGAEPLGPGHAATDDGPWSRLVTGVGVLFGVFGCVALIQSRRR